MGDASDASQFMSQRGAAVLCRVPWLLAAVLVRLVPSWSQGGRSTVDCTQILLIDTHNDILLQQFINKFFHWDGLVIDAHCLMIVTSFLLPLVQASIGDAYIIK